VRTLTLLFLLISSVVIRFLRSLAWFQQKEYRLDRVVLFLRSKEGVGEVLRLIPKKSDFSRVGLKRPKLTPRALLTAFLSLALLFLFTALVWARGWWVVILAILGFYIFLPLMIFITTLPIEIAKWLITLYWLNKASLIIKKHQPLIIGITGSYGKTSSKLMLAKVLASKYSVFTTPSSFNTKYSVSREICKNYHGQKLAVIEYGAYTMGEIATLAKYFPPQIAVLTGLTSQHLGLFGSLDNIVKAKGELVKALPTCGKVFVNAMDVGADRIFITGKSLHSEGNSLLRVSYGLDEDRAVAFSLADDGWLKIDCLGKTWQTNLVGFQYQAQVLLCLKLGSEFGLPKEKTLQELVDFQPGKNFIRSYQLKTGVRVIDDGGSSNPVGFKAALDLVSKIKAERKILVTAGIVDLGQASREIHDQLARQTQLSMTEVWYLGQVGRQEFKKTLGERLIGDQTIIKERLTKLNNHDLLLVEGRMPGWFKV